MSSIEKNEAACAESEASASKRPWVSPRLTVIGSITEVVRNPGKSGSAFEGDMFAQRKPGGTG